MPPTVLAPAGNIQRLPIASTTTKRCTRTLEMLKGTSYFTQSIRVGMCTYFMRSAASSVVSGSGRFSVSGRKNTSRTAMATSTVKTMLGRGCHTSVYKYYHSKNPFLLRNCIIPNEATVRAQEAWGCKLSGSWSSSGCQVGNYAISRQVYGFLLLSHGPLEWGSLGVGKSHMAWNVSWLWDNSK